MDFTWEEPASHALNSDLYLFTFLYPFLQTSPSTNAAITDSHTNLLGYISVKHTEIVANQRIIDRLYPIPKAYQLGVVHDGDLEGTEVLEGDNGTFYEPRQITSIRFTTILTATRARAGCLINGHETFRVAWRRAFEVRENLRGVLQYQRVDHREMLKVDVCAARESRARLRDVMSRVSEWTQLTQRLDEFSAEGSAVRRGSAIVDIDDSVRLNAV
ncbi:hypothetical protein EV421DRAFT_1903672 [Armillaria borealis]|uniref:Uncharacterized protein n=1 Tax=Armillaria borealis TaxID=47425 RepID=A0AA39MRI5_9AGAR|nr:hypothetical protein EV421DRAFT_1903672 [Armillaria borealis]